MSTVDQIQRALLDELLRGEHPPGSRVRQDELAGRLGVSKIPVREALQRLSASGLLVFDTNRGVRVPALSADEAVEHATLRRVVETELLRAAIPTMTIVDLAEAEHALDHPTSLRATSPSDASGVVAGTAVTEANWQFHRALYRPAGWTRGLAIAEMLHVAMAPYVLLYVDSLGGEAPSDDEHRALLDHCRRGDVDAATALLGQHLDNAGRSVVDFLRCEPTR